jgi:Uma2 family endonuclease
MTQSLPQNILFEIGRSPEVEHLVIEDNTPVENFFFAKLQRLLVEVLYSSWFSVEIERTFLADADIGIFSSVYQPPIVPDVFVSLDVEIPQDFREKKNRTYLIWEFGKPPDVVVEIVSNKEGNELGSKLWDYTRIGATYYVVFDPLNQLGEKVLRVHGLREGQYVELDESWLEQIGLGLTLWNREFEGITGVWL